MILKVWNGMVRSQARCRASQVCSRFSSAAWAAASPAGLADARSSSITKLCTSEGQTYRRHHHCLGEEGVLHSVLVSDRVCRHCACLCVRGESLLLCT